MSHSGCEPCHFKTIHTLHPNTTCIWQWSLVQATVFVNITLGIKGELIISFRTECPCHCLTSFFQNISIEACARHLKTHGRLPCLIFYTWLSAGKCTAKRNPSVFRIFIGHQPTFVALTQRLPHKIESTGRPYDILVTESFWIFLTSWYSHVLQIWKEFKINK